MPSPNEQAIREAARAAVAELSRRTVSDTDLIVSGGLIDSLSILKLIELLEAKLSVKIPTEKTQPEDFDSIDLIVETVQRFNA